MKLFCKKSDLNPAISHVTHSVASRTTSHILEGILFEVVDDRLSLTATDTNMTITCSLPVESDKNVSFVVNAKLIGSIVTKLPDEQILLEYDEERGMILIKSGRSSSELHTFSADEFPKIMTGEGKKIVLSKNAFRNLIKKTAFAASNDELTGILTGILIELHGGDLRMVAIDAYRMAIYSSEVTDRENELTLVVPAKLLNEVAKIISDDEEDLILETVDNKMILYFENTRVVLNTLNGKYIDYQKILTKANGSISVRVLRDELLKAIDRAYLLTSSQNNNLIKCIIEDQTLLIQSAAEEGHIHEMVDIIKEGNDLTIGFNARFVLDILKVIEDEEVTISLQAPNVPCTIKPVKGDTYTYLITPVIIN